MLWLPVIAILGLPFFVIRRLKRNLTKLGKGLTLYSEIKLKEYQEFKTLVHDAEDSSKGLFNALSHRMYSRTVWWTRLELIDKIPKKARVLDVGCGNGYLAKLIKETKNASVVCLDVADYNETEIPTVMFNGINMPFPDNSFDVVIFSFVLHHSSNPDKLLKEARRVCRGKILIYEDEAPLLKEVFAKVHYRAYNWLYDSSSPVNYYSRREWKRMFNKLGFHLTQEVSRWGVESMVAPMKRVFFELQV